MQKKKKNTEWMMLHWDQAKEMTSISGGKIKEVKNFELVFGNKGNLHTSRKALAWLTCHKRSRPNNSNIRP